MTQREIKFRAWSKVLERMVLVGGIDFEHGNIKEAQNSIGGFSMDEGVIMQFTGFKDKNGKEIYEGDILKDKEGSVVWVEWIDGAWWFCFDKGFVNRFTYDWFVNDQKGNWNLKVIGNIYDNPELLIP